MSCRAHCSGGTRLCLSTTCSSFKVEAVTASSRSRAFRSICTLWRRHTASWSWRYGEPTLTDLRESGQIEQDADAVLALYINEDESAPPGERVLQVLKNKEGTLGKFYLNFDGSTQGFAEYMDGERAVIVQTGRMEKKHENQKSNQAAAI